MTDPDPKAAGRCTWAPGTPGVLRLPSGRLVRGRALRRPLPDGPAPMYAVYLLGKQPPEVPWESDWLRWPDFRLPGHRTEARRLFTEAWVRAASERVELVCGGGRGRTGTALACLAVLDGVPPREAVEFVRAHYDRHAVETPGSGVTYGTSPYERRTARPRHHPEPHNPNVMMSRSSSAPK